jgi:hypothetical protein
VKINTEIAHLVQTALKCKEETFRRILEENEVPENLKQSILTGVQNEDDLVCKIFDNFKTAKLTEGFLRDNFHYVPPTTIKLGSGSFQYISIRETLKKIREDKTFQQMKKRRPVHDLCEDSEGFLLEDLDDGLLFKKNPFFQRHPEAIREKV